MPAREDWQDWRWDPSLFGGSSSYYRRGRPPYAPGLVEAIAAAVPLSDPAGRLLDVGCGPGVITLALAHLFDAVVGLDPDEAMLIEARRAAAQQRVGNASWVCRRAEALPAGLGSFTVITFAQSFHWMQRPIVASAVRAMIEPDGAVVQIDPHIDGRPARPHPGPHPAIPLEAIDEVRRRYLGPDRRAGKGIRNTSPSGEDAIFQAAGFLPEECTVVPDDRVLERSVDDVVAWVFASSSMAPHLFGERLDTFESDLRETLLRACPSGRFSVPLTDNQIRVRRPAPG